MSKNEINYYIKSSKRKERVPNQFLIKQILKKYDTKDSQPKDTIHNLFGRINEKGKITIKICSINISGAKNNRTLLNEKIESNDIVVVQESWHKNYSTLKKCVHSKSKQILHKTAYKTSSKGRYKGGLIFIVDEKLNCEHSFVGDNIGILILNKLVVINVYMPYYDGNQTPNYSKYVETLSSLNDLINKYKNQNKEIIICGDFNTDFARNYSYGEMLKNFCKQHELVPVDIIHNQVAQYTYFKKFRNLTIKTWIDHILVNKSNAANVKYIKILNQSDINVGDHNPLDMIYELNIDRSQKTIVNDINMRIREPKWINPIQTERYNKIVARTASKLNTILDKFLKTDDDSIKIQIATELMVEQSSILIKACAETIEYYKNEKRLNRAKLRSNNFGWNEQLMTLHKNKCKKYVEYRDSKWEIGLRQPWLNAKREFKHYKTYFEKEKANKKFRQLNCFFKSDINGFWREVKKMRMIKRIINIPLNEIREQYSKLFNNSNFPDETRDRVEKEKLDRLINEYKNKRLKDDIRITKDSVISIIKGLKNGKSIGFSCVSSEMLKYGLCEEIAETMRNIYEWMLNSGCIPHLFNISILKPLIKEESKGNDNINNLRPVSISDIYTNIYEKLILIEISRDHPDHPKQFGFKMKSSCSHANFILSEIVRLNKARKKTTFVISIDASKAFDRVCREKLWISLFEIGVKPKLIIALRNYYANFYIIVNNERDYGAPFITSYGVKQGGCISPELYKKYVEPLAIAITNLGLGVLIKRLKIDILMYADDIILIASSVNEAQKMLDVVTEFSESNQIKFNPDKTHLMIYKYGNEKVTQDLKLCKKPIVESNSVKYLGVVINSNTKNKDHIEKRKRIADINLGSLTAAGVLNQQMDTETKITLFKIYIKPVLYYGLESLQLTQEETSQLKKIEGNIVKRLLGISKKCRTTPIYSALRIESTNESIYKAQYKFLLRAIENDFIRQFIDELLEVKSGSGLISDMLKRMGINESVKVEELVKAAGKQIDKIQMDVLDRFRFGQEVEEIQQLLSISNSKFRTYKINKKLSCAKGCNRTYAATTTSLNIASININIFFV